MSTDVRPAPTPPLAPPVLGREWATYQSRRAEFVERHEGEHVLVHGEDVLGFFGSREEALAAGYERLGVVPFLVHEVRAAEPAVWLPPHAL
jgi:hypothetical protein